MSTPALIVYSDYVCPYCLLAQGTITQAADRHGVEVDWRPYELRPAPNPTLRPEDDYLPRVWAQSVYPMAQRLGIPITLPSISPQPYTHTAFEGYQYAREHGVGTQYHSAVLRAFFQQDKNIGLVDVLTGIAAGLGLDGGEFAAALTDRRYEQAHQQALAQARADVIHAVPTVLVGDYRIEGVPDADRLDAALSAVRA